MSTDLTPERLILFVLQSGRGISFSPTFSVEDEPSPGSSERLVRRGSDDVGVLEGRRRQPGGHQAGHVRHVRQQDGAAHRVAGAAEPGVVKVAGVAGDAGHDQAGAVQQRQTLHLVVVNLKIE